MIVYVETNFLITLGLKQEQCAATEAILQLARASRIDLAIPSFAILEAIHTVQGKHIRLNEAANALRTELAEMRRSTVAPPLLTTLETMIGELIQLGGEHLHDLQSAIQTVFAVGRAIDFDASHLEAAMTAQRALGLASADSIIYSAIRQDIQRRSNESPRCFLTSDVPFRRTISGELQQMGCRCIQSFDDGLSFIEKSTK